MKNKKFPLKLTIIIALLLTTASIYIIISHAPQRNENKNPYMDLIVYWKNLTYHGGTEEASEDEIGDLIADNCHYTIKDHDATDWQKEGWSSSYKANIYMLKGHDDYQTLIVENHKGKFVKVNFSQFSSNATLYDALRLYNISTETIDSATITNINTGLTSSLNKETSIKMLELLNQNYDIMPFGVGLFENTYKYSCNHS